MNLIICGLGAFAAGFSLSETAQLGRAQGRAIARRGSRSRASAAIDDSTQGPGLRLGDEGSNLVDVLKRSQALYKKLVIQDPEDPTKTTLKDKRTIWERTEDVDNYANKLIQAHEGSLDLEQRYREEGDRLPVGTKSSNGAVEHLGAGVFLEMFTPGIDNDSREEGNSATLTRVGLRDVTKEALRQFEQSWNNRRVAVVGYPGTG